MDAKTVIRGVGHKKRAAAYRPGRRLAHQEFAVRTFCWRWIGRCTRVRRDAKKCDNRRSMHCAAITPKRGRERSGVTQLKPIIINDWRVERSGVSD